MRDRFPKCGFLDGCAVMSLFCHTIASMNEFSKLHRGWFSFTLRTWYLTSFGTVILLLVLSSRSVKAQVEQPDKPQLPPLPNTAPAPDDNPTTPEKVALGKQLFFDPRLSGDNKMSCATCHLPEKALVDGLARAKGARRKNAQSQHAVSLARRFLFQLLLGWSCEHPRRTSVDSHSITRRDEPTS